MDKKNQYYYPKPLRTFLELSLLLVLILGSQASDLIAQSDYEPKRDSLLNILQQDLSDEQRVDTWKSLAYHYRRQKPDSFNYYTQKGFELSKKIGYKKGLGGAYIQKGIIKEREEKYPKAFELYQKALTIAQEIKEPLWAASALEGFARTHLFTNEFKKAKIALSKAIALYEELQDASHLQNCYRNMGIACVRLLQYDSAFYYLDLSTEIILKNNLPKIDLASNYSNIAFIHFGLDNFEKCVAYGEKSLALLEEFPHVLRKAQLLTNLGYGHFMLKNYDKAQKYLEMALVIHREKEKKTSVAYTLINLSQVYRDLGQIQRAIDALQEAIELSPAGQASYSEMLANYNLAYLYHHHDQPEKAEYYYPIALALADSTNNIKSRSDILKSMADFHHKMGNYKAAYEEYQAGKVIEDSLMNLEKINKISELQTQYETKEKENQIIELKQKELEQKIALTRNQRNQAIILATLGIIFLIGGFYYTQYRIKQKAEKNLLRQNQHLENTQAQLNQSLADQELLLKEIHHRVKNNLQVISSLLAVQSQKYDHPVIEEFVNNGRARVQAMALVHQFLYQGKENTLIAYDEYLKLLTSSIFSFFSPDKQINYQIQADAILVDIDTAIPLGLITNEIITNSLKHAFSEQAQGSIEVSLIQKSAQQAQLIISDNGKGLSNLDLENSNSFGMNLIYNLVKKIDGKLSIQNDMGTKFLLTFQNRLNIIS